MNFSIISSLLFFNLLNARAARRNKKVIATKRRCSLNTTCSNGKLDSEVIKGCGDSDLNLCLQQASEAGNVDAIHFFAGDNIFKARGKKTAFNEALKHALKAKNAKSVEALLGLKFVNPAGVPEVFKVSAGDLKIARLLVKDGRIDPSVNNNKLLSAAVGAKDLELVKLLLDDSRVQSSIDAKLKESAEGLISPIEKKEVKPEEPKHSPEEKKEELTPEVTMEESPKITKSDEKIESPPPAVEEQKAEPSPPAIEEQKAEPTALGEKTEDDQKPKEQTGESEEHPKTITTPTIPAVPIVPTEPTGPTTEYAYSEDESDSDDMIVIVRPSLKDLEERPFATETPKAYTPILERHLALHQELFNGAEHAYQSVALAALGLIALLLV